MAQSSIPRLGPTVMLLILCLAVAACENKKINKTNFEKIQTGMTLKEVEQILGGPGKKEEGGDASNVAGQFGVDTQGLGGAPRKPPGETYMWERGAIIITVYFDQNGKVTTTHSKGL